MYTIVLYQGSDSLVTAAPCTRPSSAVSSSESGILGYLMLVPISGSDTFAQNQTSVSDLRVIADS